jgi:hypothetical protein
MLPYPSSAFSPEAGFSGSLVMKDQVEVCSLSRGVIWSCDSTPIHPIISTLPYPHSFRLILRITFLA